MQRVGVFYLIMELALIFKKSVQDLKLTFGMALVASFPVSMASMALGFHKVIGLLLLLVVSGPLRAGYSKICLNIAKGIPVTIKDTFEGFSYFKNALGVFLLSLVFTFLGLIAFIIPGIVILILLSQSFFVLVENPTLEPLEVFKVSRDLMRGYELKYLSLLLIFVAIAMLLFVTKFMFLGFLIAPIQYVVFANFYKELKTIKIPAN